MARQFAMMLHVALFAGVAGVLLVPTGMCICAEGDDESATGQHEPGCPKVRQLDRAGAADDYAGDDMAAGPVALVDHHRVAGPARVIPAVGHGPPRGRPLFLTLQTLLI